MIGVILLVAIASQAYGSPPIRRNLYSESIYNTGAYLRDTPEVIAAREAHLAAVENVKRLVHRSQTTPHIQTVIKAPEHVEDATTPLPRNHRLEKIISIRLPAKDRPTVAERFSHEDDEKFSHTTNEKLIVLKFDSDGNVQQPEIYKIYLPYIIQNNNPYYKIEEVDRNSENLESDTVSSTVKETTERNVQKFTNKIAASDEHVERFVQNLYSRQNLTNFNVSPFEVKEEIRDEHVNVQGIHPYEVHSNQNAAEREVDEFVAWLEGKHSGKVGDGSNAKSPGPQESFSNQYGASKDVNVADKHVDSFVSRLYGAANTKVEDMRNFEREILEDKDFSHASVGEDKTIDEVQLEKFLEGLEEKYRNGTKVDFKDDRKEIVEEIVFKNDAPKEALVNLIFDERFGGNGKQNHSKLNNFEVVNDKNVSDIDEGVRKILNESIGLASLNESDFKVSEKHVDDLLKIVDQRIVKFVDELLTKHDAHTLENAAKELVLHKKGESVHKIIEGLVKNSTAEEILKSDIMNFQ